MDSDADSDVSMHTALSRTPSPFLKPPEHYSSTFNAGVSSQIPMVLEDADELAATAPSFDILPRFPGMYRLLDLVQERGSGGVVDKIIIAQECIKAFANMVHPGSYRSDIQVDFKALDEHVIKPRGIYGSASAIVDFLDTIGRMNDEVRSLLLRPRNDSAGITSSGLRPGLYLVSPINEKSGIAYIIFWPEDDTWRDGAISSVSRNRVTFMRYLTKLCDQLDCLISDEHSEQLVWKDEDQQDLDEDDEYSLFGGRMVGYTVEQTKEEEESAQAEEGFIIHHRTIDDVEQTPDGYPPNLGLDLLQPRLIAGETNQAILEIRFDSERTDTQSMDETLKTMALKSLLSIKRSPTIVLNESIDPVSLEIVLDYGLWDRCGNLQTEWKSQVRRTTSQRESEQANEKKRRRATVAGDKSLLESGIMFWLVRRASTFYPLVSELSLLQGLPPGNAREDEYETLIAKVDSWLEQHHALFPKLLQEITDSFKTLGTNSSTQYNTLKRRLLQVASIRNNPRFQLSARDIQRLANLVTSSNEMRFKDGIDEVLNQEKKGSGTVGWLFSYVVGGPQVQAQDFDTGPTIQDDLSFSKPLEVWSIEKPEYYAAITQLRLEIADLLRRKIKGLSKAVPTRIERVLQDTIDEEIRLSFGKRQEREQDVAWDFLRKQVRQRLTHSSPKNRNSTKLIINSVQQIMHSYMGYRTPSGSFHFKGRFSTPKKEGFEYTIFPIDIKQDDMVAISSNLDHICRPVVRPHSTQAIFLPVSASIRFIRLLEKDRAFVVVEEQGLFRVYLETLDFLSSAISGKRAIKVIHSEKVGPDPLFALDETRRFFAVLATPRGSIQLYMYAYDVATKSLTSRGSAENLSRWFQGTPKFSHILFVGGIEEVLLVEKGGICRIYSLVTTTFRSSYLQLIGDPESVFSSSDGACLLVKIMGEDGPHVLCYHWASFGMKGGTEIPWPAQIPANSQMVVSSVGHRNSNHAIFMARRQHFCQSLRVRISSSSSEFAFRSNLDATGLSNASKTTTNNSLIDCHAEVWTRFPVNAAIVKATVTPAKHHPRSILFVSKNPSEAFASYFKEMVREFEHKTRKPTKNILQRIKIVASDEWDSSSPQLATSEFQTGDWLVGLFCLIPIHLAVTRSNRFIPLKDGVDSPRFEHSLLGANVAQISEALSFGWYESIFASYLANKPVKVVTSMGEQSVGKSFALNHFVDTSFAGSAMRCTEGVWLSVTPTNDYLVVAMDFEGVHSIERSAQEDTLLVLLNSAISNFVLFRNNFALSRDISGLFSSFQSCTKVLDPALNPSLFHSTLGIIIKDVIDSDTKEIVNEFQQKFQSIVQRERANNFISKLHRGKLDIIPWPVIESARFYDLFVGLKKRLDRQPITHKHAGAFLGVLKMLMAKLKANDWGALDQNLAVQRAQHLGSLLSFALAFGTTDPVNEEPLKNYDTDELLDNTDCSAIFFIEGISHPMYGQLSLDSCLMELRMGWKHRQDRYSMTEHDFVSGYNNHLRLLVEARIGHVQRWIEANTYRFGEKAEVTTLRRTFDQLSKDLKATVVLCGSKCTTCGLLCLGHKQHDGDHNCRTDHKCPELCGFEDQHEEAIGCDLPAGHIDRHVCSGTPHLCGMQCQMYSRNGCLTACTKPMDHDENEGHQCAAGMHTCGELCSLVQRDGTRLCTRSCTLDCRIDHEQHTCDRSLSCPIKCQLCNSYCAAGDHFHALKAGAVHLCGQNHNCTHKCEMAGVCEINTTPHSIESTFTGKFTSFQYTKYTQEARRLPCIVSLKPDQLVHGGPHVHTNDPKPFHYCEERCKHCGYYCTLPLGHSQLEHSTSHGSMSQTEWFVEGDEDVIEVQGRKYATGDSGAPMLCSLLCETLGRHVHIDSCRSDEDGNCVGPDLTHIDIPRGRIDKDWITHRLFWARSGFEDPYSRQKQDEFTLCDHRCGGPEHDTETNTDAKPSYCTLPLFHEIPDPSDVPPLGHISHDGHAYNCKNPVLMQRSFHIYFAYDWSGSMYSADHQPLSHSPATHRIRQVANNRFGALASSMYGFWTARGAAVRSGGAAGVRRDAYTLIPFATTALSILSNDTTSDPDQLLEIVLQPQPSIGYDNDFGDTLRTVQREMERTWSTERTPVVIFLSDGEDVGTFREEDVYNLCRKAVTLGKPLTLHSILFGTDAGTHSLTRMAAIAREVYDSAPKDPLAPSGNPSTFTSALDTIQLVDTFAGIATSLKNTRAALSRF